MNEAELIQDVLGTSIKGISKNDAKNMLTRYKSLKRIILQVNKDCHEFMKLKYFGINKVKRLNEAFKGNFIDL